MGITNHGIQSITFQYFLEATGANFGKRLLGILPPGIYSGGYLTRVSDSEVTLSILVAEIKGTTNQISVRTASAATLNASTLDSGSISSGTPYLALRWAYAASTSNYVEVHALASVAAAAANDIIIGKCVFVGSTLTSFDYTDRTFLNVQNLFLRVEADSGLYVWIRSGRINNGSGYVLVPEQRVGPFTVPGSPNSRIDLVYVDTDGTVSIQQGTAAVSPVAPDYNDKLVVAQVQMVNGDTSIPASRITDVRAFIAKPKPDEATTYSGGESYTFAGGRIEKDGIAAYTGSNKTVTFVVPFPNEIRNVQLTVEKSPWNTYYSPILISKSVSQIVISLGNVTGVNIHWRVVGR